MEQMNHMRRLRLQHGIQLKEIAGAAGCSEQYISKIELGVISPTARIDYMMRDAFEKLAQQRINAIQALWSDYWSCRHCLFEQAESNGIKSRG